MIEKTMEVDRMEDVISVFGSFDQNLRMIETEYNVRVTDRDEQIHITGEAENVLYAEKAIAGLLSLAAKGEEIGEQNVRYIFRLVREGREQKIQELAGDVVCITAKGKPIKAKTLGQRAYLDAIEQNTITLGVGPAGTGKTYLAVAEAVAAFRAERVNRIILTRPAVEAGERLGFLPGDLQNKVDPYLRPLYDALFEMLGADAYAKYLERGNIEVAPLAYMRGRTLDDSFIILDEAQNTSREQMKMFLTRIGFARRHHRRRDADRPAVGQAVRPQGGHPHPRRHRRHRHLPPDGRGRRAPRARAEDHRRLRAGRQTERKTRRGRGQKARRAQDDCEEKSMTQAKITITRTRRGLGFPDTQRYVKRAAAAALRAEGVTVPCEFDVTLTDDAVIHTINREQRGVDRATDVLSFPMNELTPGAFDPDACEWDYETDRAMLGDMVISMERCAEQAETYGHSFAHEVSYLTVHSVLHLLGYDHVDEGEDKRRMRAREKEIMRLLDV